VSRSELSLAQFAQHGQSIRSRIVGSFTYRMGVSFGVSVLVWQHLLGVDLYWVILPLAVILLLAVGSDYNLLLVSRFKEEIHAGINTGIIRSMAGSGSVVTAAGLVFAFTMASFIFSDLRVLGQIGTTIALGLMFDTLIVRSFMTRPSPRCSDGGSGGRCGCARGQCRRSSVTRARDNFRCSRSCRRCRSRRSCGTCPRSVAARLRGVPYEVLVRIRLSPTNSAQLQQRKVRRRIPLRAGAVA
jgi:hypothetical protein